MQPAGQIECRKAGLAGPQGCGAAVHPHLCPAGPQSERAERQASSCYKLQALPGTVSALGWAARCGVIVGESSAGPADCEVATEASQGVEGLEVMQWT